MEVIQDLIPIERHNRPGLKMKPTSITVHNTGNRSTGANAKMHAKFIKSTDKNVSWHFTVDDIMVIQHVPIDEIAWHAGNNKGNMTSIGVEICMHQGIDMDKAERNAIALIADLMEMKDIQEIKKHQEWTGKYCPTVLLSENRWEEFEARCRQRYQEQKEKPHITTEHWAQVYYEKLMNHGIMIHERRYDDKMTRGEVFALLSQLVD